MSKYNIVIVGGGLSGCLTAYRLSQTNATRILLIEAGALLGGNHTWSFHETDIDVEARGWMDPFVAHRWHGHTVRFPGRKRTLKGSYWSVTSDRLRDTMAGAAHLDVRTTTEIGDLTSRSITFADGDTLEAGIVLDARGDRGQSTIIRRFQKFLGQEVETTAPHGLSQPILMDADVPQADGYRFVYVLPLSDNRLLIEDTYYADGPDLETDRLRASISDYAAAQGWSIGRVLREEAGALPIALGGRPRSVGANDAPPIGLAAGLFHPTTGYSLPDAVALADRLATVKPPEPARIRREIDSWTDDRWRQRRYYRFLNRMMFLAGRPQDRWRIMARFYRLPEPLIARFYGARLTLSDKARILMGKPPVPIGGALKVLSERSLT